LKVGRSCSRIHSYSNYRAHIGEGEELDLDLDAGKAWGDKIMFNFEMDKIALVKVTTSASNMKVNRRESPREMNKETRDKNGR